MTQNSIINNKKKQTVILMTITRDQGKGTTKNHNVVSINCNNMTVK